MLLIAVALVVGISAGLISGGSPKNLAEVRFRWWPLAILGLALQFVPVPSSATGHHLGVGLLIASYGLLLAFVALNLQYRGFALMGIGFAMNILVISVNGGMPVSPHALRQSEPRAYPESVARLRAQGGAKHHVERDDDKLTEIADVVGIGPPVRHVYSPGDLVALLGLAVVGAEAARAPRRPYAPKHAAPGRRRSSSWVSLPPSR